MKPYKIFYYLDSKPGYFILQAYDKEHAIKKAKEDRFGIVIYDCMLLDIWLDFCETRRGIYEQNFNGK
jgi:DNA-binding response OmpR family regulator